MSLKYYFYHKVDPALAARAYPIILFHVFFTFQYLQSHSALTAKGKCFMNEQNSCACSVSDQNQPVTCFSQYLLRKVRSILGLVHRWLRTGKKTARESPLNSCALELRWELLGSTTGQSPACWLLGGPTPSSVAF